MAKIINAPAKYVQGKGELQHLDKYYQIYGSKGLYILADPFIAEHYKEMILKPFEEKNIPYQFQIFGGECCDSEIEKHVKQLQDSGCDVILGVGGGKTLDTAKAVGYGAHTPVLGAPTVASTDAPCSALSVVYTENGEFDRYLMLPAGPNIVIMDEEVIAKAPARLLAAGIGDALATFFEADAAVTKHAVTTAGGTATRAAHNLAAFCLDTLLKDGEKAMAAVKNHVVTQALENIIEANTYLSGIGFESAGLAAAHAIHNGLTVLEETHKLYHGEKVAFGTLTQLILENRSLDEIQKIVGFCKRIGLPTNFKDLGIENVTREQLQEVAKVANAEGDTMCNMPFPVSDDDVVAALLTANELGQ